MDDAIQKSSGWLSIVFACLLLASCVWVLSLPVFPSQDGPMHMYFVHVLGSLLAKSPTFAPFFYIRNLLPPYALHYYILIVLVHVFGAAIAEKLMVCLIFIVMATGFRFLATGISRAGATVSLLVFPLLLNWPLMMGFINYSLSVGLALWALGMWWRSREVVRLPYLAGFALMCGVITLTHPVPLLFVLCFGAADLALALPVTSVTTSVERRVWLQRAVVFAVASCCVFYVLHFTEAKRVATNVHESFSLVGNALHFLRLSSLAVYAGNDALTYVYRLGLYALLVWALAAAVRAWTSSPLSPLAYVRQSPFLLLTLLLLVVVVVLPRDMNGSHFFSDRLLILCWLGALTAACANRGLVAWSRTIAAVAVTGTVLVLLMGNARIRPIATEIAETRNHPWAVPAGSAGLLLGENEAARDTRLKRVSFNPYTWIQAYNFAATDTVLLNPPWLDLAIMPLGAKAPMLTGAFTPAQMDSPGNLKRILVEDEPAARAHVESRARFVLMPSMALQSSLDLQSWQCEPHGLYAFCTRP